MTIPWTVKPSPTDSEMMAVVGAYLVADNLPIEDAALISAAPDMRDALKDMLSGWRYLRTYYGNLAGVGWDRCETSATAALAKAELSA